MAEDSGPEMANPAYGDLTDEERAAENAALLAAAEDSGRTREDVANWKTFDCPTCDSRAGESCGTYPVGSWVWQRTNTHVARKRLALSAAGQLPKEPTRDR